MSNIKGISEKFGKYDIYVFQLTYISNSHLTVSTKEKITFFIDIFQRNLKTAETGRSNSG